MPRGDVQSRSYRGSGGYSSSTEYDDEGRGDSKSVWEWFESHFDGTVHWLISQEDKTYHWLLSNSRDRYGIDDIAMYWATKSEEERIGRKVDSRARRLVEKKLDEDAWYLFHTALVEGYDREKQRIEDRRRERYAKAEIAAEELKAEREAKAAEVRREDAAKISKEIDLTAGALRSDVHQAVTYREVYDQDEGSWIDDVVYAYTTGRGFGDEVKEQSGIKLQITVSLDLSNSMTHNLIDSVAANAFREISLSLKHLRNEYPDSLHVGFFTFSEDEWGGKRGRRAQRVGHSYYGSANISDEVMDEEFRLHEFERFRPNKLNTSWELRTLFSGEDTWITPLLEAIEKWERKHSDPKAARLDLVITDAVLEHPTDIRSADVVQERRDGNLQTVFLNFLPEEDWLGSTLPLRCVQYPANPDNISGLLRMVVAQFLAVYV